MLDAIDDFRVERLAGARDLTKPNAIVRQVLADQHPPDGRRRTERRHTASHDSLEHALRVEALVVVDEDRCTGVPRSEDAAPRMLGPTRGADVPVDVAGTEADPIHRRQMPDGIA